MREILPEKGLRSAALIISAHSADSGSAGIEPLAVRWRNGPGKSCRQHQPLPRRFNSEMQQGPSGASEEFHAAEPQPVTFCDGAIHGFYRKEADASARLRRDTPNRLFHKEKWIPAFAGMTLRNGGNRMQTSQRKHWGNQEAYCGSCEKPLHLTLARLSRFGNPEPRKSPAPVTY